MFLFFKQHRFYRTASLFGTALACLNELIRRFDHWGAGRGGIQILQDKRCGLSPIVGDS
jgi:hypothetical protein